MAKATNSRPSHRLHLRVAGWLADDWFGRLDGISIRRADDGSTVLCGELKDQSALFGLLRSIENHGMKLIACFAYPGDPA